MYGLAQELVTSRERTSATSAFARHDIISTSELGWFSLPECSSPTAASHNMLDSNEAMLESSKCPYPSAEHVCDVFGECCPALATIDLFHHRALLTVRSALSSAILSTQC